MRRKLQKERCLKVKLSKSKEICKLYDKVQEMYAQRLEEDKEIKEFLTNVEIKLSNIILNRNSLSNEQQFTTDFVVYTVKGDIFVRECVFIKSLGWPSTLNKLQASKEYWQEKGIEEWGIIISAERKDDRS